MQTSSSKDWAQYATELLRKTLTPPRHELNELDWKQAISPNKKRLAEHLSAFSNYPGGGFLVYGVANTGKLETIDEKTISDTLNQLSNIGRHGLEPAICLDHSVEDFDGEKLLFVRVSENPVKPVHVKGDIRETFVRSGGTSRKANKQELATLMLHSKTLRWEELRATTLMSDGEMAAKLDTKSIFAFLNRKDFTSQEELLDWLAAEKFISREPSGGGYLTNLGVLACAYTLAEFTDLARKAVRVITYKGFNKASAKEEVVGQKSYAIGFQGLIHYIVGRLPKSEVIEQALRVKRSVYPEIALREIIANALIHQDFTVSGASPMVEIYDDRIEISNPGSLLPNKEADRLIGAQPESRNQELAQAFMRYGICEQRGSGLIKAGQQGVLRSPPD